MVERLEGFCTENDWKRAYNEINEFEKELSDWGAVIIKFWVQIDKDTPVSYTHLDVYKRQTIQCICTW